MNFKCTKCLHEKPEASFWFRKNGIRYTYCKNCAKTIKHEYYIANKQRLIEYQREYDTAHRDILIKKKKDGRKNNPEKYISYYKKRDNLIKNDKSLLNRKRMYSRKGNKKICDELSDRYIAYLIVSRTPLSSLMIYKYPELIQAKRMQLLIHRELNKLNNGTN